MRETQNSQETIVRGCQMLPGRCLGSNLVHTRMPGCGLMKVLGVQTIATQGQASLPGQLVIVTDKGKTSKEQGNLVVKEAMCAMLQAWDAPFRSAALSPLDCCSLP